MIDVNEYINDNLKFYIWENYYIGDDTFVTYISLTDEFIKIFDEYITQEDLETGVEFYAEYWLDDDTLHYFLSFENDNIQVTDTLKNIFPDKCDSQNVFKAINNEVKNFYNNQLENDMVKSIIDL